MDSVPAEITGKMLAYGHWQPYYTQNVLLEESSSYATAFLVKMRMKVDNIQTLDHHVTVQRAHHIKKFLEDA